MISLGVQFGGDEIVKSKQGAGGATTRMTYTGLRFVKAILSARNGVYTVEEAYVYLLGVPGDKEIATELGVDYFAVKVQLGKARAATQALPISKISALEKQLLEGAIRDLKGNVATGVDFAAQ